MEEQYPMQSQQVPVSSDELYANAINEEKIRNVISQLDPENQLKDIEMRIRGYKKNAFSQSGRRLIQMHLNLQGY